MIIKPDFTGWQYYTGIDMATKQEINVGIKFTHENGLVESRGLHDQDVVAWLADGNQPLPASGE
jgi:hypothetical protein